MGFSLIAGIMVLLLWQENDLKKYKAWVQENTQFVHDPEKITLIRRESKEKYLKLNKVNNQRFLFFIFPKIKSTIK